MEEKDGDRDKYRLEQKLDRLEQKLEKFLEFESVQKSHESKINKIENKMDNLNIIIDRDIPKDLNNRLSIIQSKLDNDVKISRLESQIIILENSLVDSKATMKERLAFVTIIVALVVAILTKSGFI